LVQRQIDISAIAHALHLELTNGWSFSFCLRYCEEVLEIRGGLVCAKASVGLLTSRARAGVDEQLASAVTIALGLGDGYAFLGDLGRYTKGALGMVSRLWTGNGPDHLMAQHGSPVDGYVARFRFLEAKGNAIEFTKNKLPRDFYAFKAQSLNAEMTFPCQQQPILSYVYLPVDPPDPIVAQWFNSPPRPQGAASGGQTEQALMLLQIAHDQFYRLVDKSQLARTGEPFGIDRDARNWLPARRYEGRLWFITTDGREAVAVEEEALSLFSDVGRLLDRIQSAGEIESHADQVLGAAKRLRVLSSGGPDFEKLANFDGNGGQERYIGFGEGYRFQVLARDACGLLYLRRVPRSVIRRRRG
jgi:hypothetical protein